VRTSDLVAVGDEPRLDPAPHGEVAADEEKILIGGPVRDFRRLLEDGVVEEQEQADPEQLDDNLDQEVAAKRQFAEQAELGEREPEFETAQEHDYPPYAL
jgi:hypothetical protein